MIQQSLSTVLLSSCIDKYDKIKISNHEAMEEKMENYKIKWEWKSEWTGSIDANAIFEKLN